MTLTEYITKRNFNHTTEPKNNTSKHKTKNVFVIQKHHSSHLHFDLRLELGGVLKSWAVPKGLSLDPQIKRLAVHVEDHPLDYAYFEGEIPKGEYGAGTVEIWDRGAWIPPENVDEQYRKGLLEFELHGTRYHGKWLLIKMKTNEKNWLLIKKKN